MLDNNPINYKLNKLYLKNGVLQLIVLLGILRWVGYILPLFSMPLF